MTHNWKPTNWDALLSGEQCPLCERLHAAELNDDHGLFIADLRFSRLRLSRNQFVAGYSVLICKRHVIEPHELSAQERALFFEDVAQAGRALQTVFGADKMNYQMLGNAIPHLHAHIIPRYFIDPAPQRPIDPTPPGQEVYLTEAEYAERIAKIRRALA